MKLRIEGSSLRMRLSEAEVQQFAQSGRVAETVIFGPAPEQQLHYVLLRSPDHQVVAATFTAGTVTIHLPADLAQAWASSEQNGLKAQVDNGRRGLRLLVEKDLGCLHRD